MKRHASSKTLTVACAAALPGQKRLALVTLLLVFLVSNLANATVGFQMPVTYPVGPAPVAVAIGDFNGDGTFQNATAVATGFSPSGLTVFDVNSDGKLDLVTTVGPHGIETFLGSGDGTFQQAILCSCGTESDFEAFEPTEGANFNEDGDLDLAVMLFHADVQHNSFHAKETVLLGHGDGAFERLADFVSTPSLSPGIGRKLLRRLP